MSELSKFIAEKYDEKITSPQIDAHIAEYENSLKAITIRLHPDVLKTLDNIANYFDISRQELNTQILESGITEILYTLAKESLHARKKLPDDIDADEYQKLIEEERTVFIRELCA